MYEDNWYEGDWDLATRPNWAVETSFSGLVYHGSMLTEIAEAVWTDLTDSYSDWGAVWVTPDERAAKEFAGRYRGSRPLGGDGDEIPFVIRVEGDFQNLLDLTNFTTDAADFRDEWCGGDIRDCIDHFRRWGFDGWITNASIGRLVYKDIAVWNGAVGGTEVKILMPDGKWSAYMSEEEANELLGFAT